MRVLRAALTETRNAFTGMSDRVADLAAVAPRLDEVRRANVDHNLELIAEAAAGGAQVVGLGELFPAPYFALTREPIWHAMAEDAERGPTVTAVREAAPRHVLVVVAPIYELMPKAADGSTRPSSSIPTARCSGPRDADQAARIAGRPELRPRARALREPRSPDHR